VWLTAIFGVLGGIGISMSAGNSFGAGLSMFYALIPLPGLWLAYWWLDRYEPEPPRYKFAAFVWGGVVAVTFALVSQVLIEKTFGFSDNTMAAIVAPATEEPAKSAFLLLTFLRMRRVIDGFIDGLVYAGLVGVGFAFIENIGYYSASYLGSSDEKLAGAAGTTATFVMRGIFSPLAHPGFTAAFGIALGVAISTFARRSRLLQGAVILFGLAASIALHGVWNMSLAFDGGRGFLIVYLALTGGLLVLTIFAIVVRFRQVHTLEASLRAIAGRGWIHPDEIPYLSRFRYRKAARKYAGQHYGRMSRKVVRRYQQLATEAAFLHHALMTGRHVPDGVERTYSLLDEMYGLRPQLRLPPALRRADDRAAVTAVH
jgi:RsiW-degrading membrane proteinase PrsW (M82 family)